MLNKEEVICFAATKNPEKAKHFYSEKLALSLIEENQFALVYDANGTMLRIQKVQEHTPAGHTVLGWRVEDIYSKIKALVDQGVRFERFESLPQDEFAVWQSPSGALVAWFRDPDGNCLSLTQFSAKPGVPSGTRAQ